MARQHTRTPVRDVTDRARPDPGRARTQDGDRLVAAVGPPAPLELLARLRQLLDDHALVVAEATERTGHVVTQEPQLTSVEPGPEALGGQLGAAEMIRASLPIGACGEPWAACTHCLGSELADSPAASWCPSCGRPGLRPDAGTAYLCADRAVVTLRDSSGGDQAVCLSHAAAALGHRPGLTVVAADEEDVRALVFVLHKPVRVDTRTSRSPHPVTDPERS